METKFADSLLEDLFKCDEESSEGKLRITWTNQSNKETEVCMMADAELNSLVLYLLGSKLPKTQTIIVAEIRKRKDGFYPPEFDALIKEYKRLPEIWRLKIY